jgi:hypothetical protein
METFVQDLRYAARMLVRMRSGAGEAEQIDGEIVPPEYFRAARRALVLGEGLRLAGAGAAIGVTGALVGARLLQRWLVAGTNADARLILGVVVVMMSAAGRPRPSSLHAERAPSIRSRSSARNDAQRSAESLARHGLSERNAPLSLALHGVPATLHVVAGGFMAERVLCDFMSARPRGSSCSVACVACSARL